MQAPATSSFMIPPTLRAPVLNAKSGRWASETMTGDLWAAPQFPATASFATSDVTEARGGHPLPPEFPPPPPPMGPALEEGVRAQARMMRWYQQAELWGLDPRVKDNQRLVVAPPPRPPPFAHPATSATPLMEVSVLARQAPYDFAGWVQACRRWWVHVSRIFEKLNLMLRAPPMAPMPSPSTNAVLTPASRVGLPMGSPVPVSHLPALAVVEAHCAGFGSNQLPARPVAPSRTSPSHRAESPVKKRGGRRGEREAQRRAGRSAGASPVAGRGSAASPASPGGAGEAPSNKRKTRRPPDVGPPRPLAPGPNASTRPPSLAATASWMTDGGASASGLPPRPATSRGGRLGSDIAGTVFDTWLPKGAGLGNTQQQQQAAQERRSHEKARGNEQAPPGVIRRPHMTSSSGGTSVLSGFASLGP